MTEDQKVLILCTTPLQTVIAKEIILHEKIKDFFVIYYTRHNSQTDKLYYSEIAKNSKESKYVYVEKEKSGTLSQAKKSLDAIIFSRKNKYSRIYLASIDSLLFRKIIKYNQSSSIYTFDDGTANITPTSIYHLPEKDRKIIALRIFARIPSIEETKSRASKHYTIYPEFKNILPKNKIINIKIFQQEPKKNQKEKQELTIFIGQPFDEYLKKKSIDQIKAWLKKTKIDIYFKHPREKHPITSKARITTLPQRLSEEEIFYLSKDFNVTIISAYSSVLFNIPNNIANKIYLCADDSQAEKHRCNLIKKTGARILEINLGKKN